jgi:hypothetical protein
LDADVWLEDPLWYQKSIHALSRYHLVRPFSHSLYLPSSDGSNLRRVRLRWMRLIGFLLMCVPFHSCRGVIVSLVCRVRICECQ